MPDLLRALTPTHHQAAPSCESTRQILQRATIGALDSPSMAHASIRQRRTCHRAQGPSSPCSSGELGDDGRIQSHDRAASHEKRPARRRGERASIRGWTLCMVPKPGSTQNDWARPRLNRGLCVRLSDADEATAPMTIISPRLAGCALPAENRLLPTKRHGVLYEHEGDTRIRSKLVRAAHKPQSSRMMWCKRKKGVKAIASEGACRRSGASRPAARARHMPASGLARSRSRPESNASTSLPVVGSARATSPRRSRPRQRASEAVRAQGVTAWFRCGRIDRLCAAPHALRGSTSQRAGHGSSRAMPTQSGMRSAAAAVASRAGHRVANARRPTSRGSLTAAKLPTLVALVTDPPPHAP
jgi:hypothetical protein